MLLVFQVQARPQKEVSLLDLDDCEFQLKQQLPTLILQQKCECVRRGGFSTLRLRGPGFLSPPGPAKKAASRGRPLSVLPVQGCKERKRGKDFNANDFAAAFFMEQLEVFACSAF